MNCDVCDPEFALRVNLRRHDTLTQTAIYVMPIFLLRVKLRRHIRSRPLKPAPATCYFIVLKYCVVMY